LGVSSIGINEPEFHRLTYQLTVHVAGVLSRLNPDMTFYCISGPGTDSTGKGKSMWARVKGKNENDLMKLPFKQVFLFRPGFIRPTPGLKNTLRFYRYINWAYPIRRSFFPKFVSTLKELGLATIHVSQRGHKTPVLEVSDIVELAR